MNTPQLHPPLRPRTKPSALSAAGSVMLHALLFGLLLVWPKFPGGHRPHPKFMIAIALTPDNARSHSQIASSEHLAPTPAPPRVDPSTAPKRPVQIPTPRTFAPPTPKIARPVPPKPAPERKPAPHPPPLLAAVPKPIAQPVLPAPVAPKRVDNVEAAMIAMLDHIRENWLPPKHTAKAFRCRFRVDYLSGGIISNVTMLQGCGNDELNDSVERAVWKTQPLPLASGHANAGTINLDFSP